MIILDMSDIVKIKNNECFIDSEGLALLSKLETRTVNQLIKRKSEHLLEFGSLSLAVINPEGPKGGRPKHLYSLNEQQETLLTTFMNNSETVMTFKKKLVKEFFLMRSLLQKQQAIRIASKEVRKSLTDAVQESGENERMHGRGYSNYTRMVYSICGLSEKYKLWKSYDGDIVVKFRDYISADELKRVEQAEAFIKPLLEMDKQYSEIKDILKPLFENKKEIE